MVRFLYLPVFLSSHFSVKLTLSNPKLLQDRQTVVLLGCQSFSKLVSILLTNKIALSFALCPLFNVDKCSSLATPLEIPFCYPFLPVCEKKCSVWQASSRVKEIGCFQIQILYSKQDVVKDNSFLQKMLSKQMHQTNS